MTRPPEPIWVKCPNCKYHKQLVSLRVDIHARLIQPLDVCVICKKDLGEEIMKQIDRIDEFTRIYNEITHILIELGIKHHDISPFLWRLFELYNNEVYI